MNGQGTCAHATAPRVRPGHVRRPCNEPTRELPSRVIRWLDKVFTVDSTASVSMVGAASVSEVRRGGSTRGRKGPGRA
eukprot:405228-Prorocentrum_minimum.AAC.1